MLGKPPTRPPELVNKPFRGRGSVRAGPDESGPKITDASAKVAHWRGGAGPARHRRARPRSLDDRRRCGAHAGAGPRGAGGDRHRRAQDDAGAAPGPGHRDPHRQRSPSRRRSTPRSPAFISATARASKKGDELFTLDCRQIEADMKRVEAVINGAQATFEQAQRDVERYTDLVGEKRDADRHAQQRADRRSTSRTQRRNRTARSSRI